VTQPLSVQAVATAAGSRHLERLRTTIQTTSIETVIIAVTHSETEEVEIETPEAQKIQ
jgi:hypothetical protein